MPLTQIQLILPADGLEAWSDAILAAGAASVVVEDAEAGTGEESARYGEPGLPQDEGAWRSNRVSVLLDESADAGDLLARAAAAVERPVPAVFDRRTVDDCDWVRLTQSQFGPISVGRIWIVPSWHEPPDPAACNIRMDPGAAFGTGTHPTTRLCLEWIDARLRPGSRVLDYGCGSGILSIAAILLGAAEAVGTDIDPKALETAADNARRNAVAAQYTSPETLASRPAASFDLVVANILADPIMTLAPTLLRHLAPEGSLLLSGILERQAGDVMSAFARVDPRMRLACCAHLAPWVAICGTRAH